MHYPRLTLAAATFGLLAALPALAAQGDVSSIGLRDFNRNGKIDRAVITLANPSLSTWTVHGTSGFGVTYKGTPIAVSDVFLNTSADPAVLEVVLDENDANLPVDTSSESFEVTYHRVGAASGVSDGVNELSPIASGDTGANDTELDQAAPILISSTPEPGTVDYLRAEALTLSFSEPVRSDSLVPSSMVNPGGWLLTLIGDGHTVSVQHDVYPRATNETFGIAAKDLAGNALVTDSFPNPFTFQTSSDNSPNTRVDPVFLLTSPTEGTTLAAGEATLLAWYTNVPTASTVKLSYSLNAGRTWQTIVTVPAAQKGYVWYPPALLGALQFKAEARDASNVFISNSVVRPVFVSGTASVAPLRAVSSGEISGLTASSATLSIRLDRTPSSATFSCNGGALTAAVSVTGDRPARLSAALTNLTAGTSYACAFRVTDASGAALDLAIPTFLAGVDTSAPQLAAPAVIDQYDAAAGTARLSWTTDEASTASVSYGVYLNYGSTANATLLSTSHSVTLTGLVPGKMHQARITSIDALGNAGVSKDYYFIFLRENDLIKGAGPAVYWYKDGKRSAFPNLDSYRSYFGNDFSKVIRVPDTQLGTITLGANVKMKAGAYLIKIQSDPKTYAVEPNGTLRWIQTEAQAKALYGTAWAARVRDVDVSLFTDYAIGAPLEGNEKPAGYAG